MLVEESRLSPLFDLGLSLQPPVCLRSKKYFVGGCRTRAADAVKTAEVERGLAFRVGVGRLVANHPEGRRVGGEALPQRPRPLLVR